MAPFRLRISSSRHDYDGGAFILFALPTWHACSYFSFYYCCGLAVGISGAFRYDHRPVFGLVPFLVFAIGISHGVQIINGIAIEAGKGADRLTAARRAFRALYAPGMLALISDGMGF